MLCTYMSIGVFVRGSTTVSVSVRRADAHICLSVVCVCEMILCVYVSVGRCPGWLAPVPTCLCFCGTACAFIPRVHTCVRVCLLCSVVFARMSLVCVGVSGVSVPLCECMLVSVTVCVSTECTYVCMYVGVLDTGGQGSGFGG